VIRRTLATLSLGALTLGLGVAAGLSLLWYLVLQPILTLILNISGGLA
jgi:hypothetical protein